MVSTPGVAASIASGASGVGLVLSALVGGLDRWEASPGLAVVGAAAIALGVAGLTRYRVARREGPVSAFAALIGVLLTQVAVSTSAYLATGTFDRVDDALFESVAGFSTTALTVVADPEVLPSGVAFWRALTQWTGGLTALVAAGLVVPVLGVARGAERASGPGRLPLASRQALGLIGRLFRIYAVLTVAGIALFAGTGMGPFDAVSYAMTTISSGGFARHADSLGHFDSALIEWAAVGGMVLAGVNLAVVFRSARGLATGTVLRSAELRTFLGIIVVLAATVVWVAQDGGAIGDRIRHSVFAVISMLSTTGHWASDWGAWSEGAQVILVLAAGIGAMSGAIGGGFRVARMLAVLGFIRREVLRQMHPNAVLVVKVGRRAVNEVLMDRIVGHQLLYLFIGGVGAVGLAVAGASVLTSLTGVVSALSTVGPAMGDLTPGGGARVLTAPARAVLMPMMLLGRLELAPVLVGMTIVGRRRRTSAHR